MEAMIRSASLRGFVPLVEELGGDADALLARFGMTRALVADDEGRVSISAHDRMLDAAAAELPCADLGLRLAERQDLSILGPLAVAIQSSASVGDALECASRFMFVHSPALTVGVEPDPWGRADVVALTYRKDVRESPYSPQGTELGLALFHLIAVTMLGSQVGLRSVELPHRPLSPVARYTSFFGTDVKFGRATAALRVERRVLAERFVTADEGVLALALDFLDSAYADPGREVSTQVRRALAGTLHVATPAIAGVARILAVHPRTLQRRLAVEGTTFERVLDEVRRDAAHRWITTTDLPLGRVSALVGLAEQSGLSHAVRRWYGVTPRELRRAARPTPANVSR